MCHKPGSSQQSWETPNVTRCRTLEYVHAHVPRVRVYTRTRWSSELSTSKSIHFTLVHPLFSVSGRIPKRVNARFTTLLSILLDVSLFRRDFLPAMRFLITSPSFKLFVSIYLYLYAARISVFLRYFFHSNNTRCVGLS